MRDKKIKHNKLRNSGLLFEFLLRQVTADVLDKNDKSKALKIVKEFFNEHSELGNERALYNMLVNQKYKTDKQAGFFISEVIKARAKINNSTLRREKYRLITEIQKNYDLSKFLSTSVPNYKVYASVYKLFEYGDRLAPEDKTQTYFNLIENITSEPKPQLSDSVNKKLQYNDELRAITYRILLERFNQKYNYLNRSQKYLLKNYINNVSNTNSLGDIISAGVNELRESLTSMLHYVDDKVTQIKLKETINSIGDICLPTKPTVIKDSSVLQLMRYYELEKELKKHGRVAKKQTKRAG